MVLLVTGCEPVLSPRGDLDMTNAAVRVSAEEWDDRSDGETTVALGVERVAVSFDAEEGADPACAECGGGLVELQYGHRLFVHADDDECDNCGGSIWLDGSGTWRHQGGSDPIYCPDWDPSEDDDKVEARPAHEPIPESGPGTWCNSAAVVVNDEEDSVTVTISVGDPRGAFAFTVRKVAPLLGETGEVLNPDLVGRLLLHVPYPGESLPHAALAELHPGTFLVGGAA